MNNEQQLRELLDNASNEKTREKLLNRYRAMQAIEEGITKTTVARQFGIDRTSLHKLWNRYLKHGMAGLVDQYPTGKSHHNTLDIQTAGLIASIARRFPALYPLDISYLLQECYNITVSHTTVLKYCKLEGLENYREKKGNGCDELYTEEISKNSTEKYYVSLLRVNGKDLVHIRIWKREYTRCHDNPEKYDVEYLPTHRGLLLTVDQIQEIMKALEETLPLL